MPRATTCNQLCGRRVQTDRDVAEQDERLVKRGLQLLLRLPLLPCPQLAVYELCY